MWPSAGHGLNLDRVRIDGVLVHRLSATLRVGIDDPRVPADSPWWVYLGCQPIPGHFGVGRLLQLDAQLVGGRSIRGQARIVERQDDGYGTELILAGVHPLPAAVE